MQSIRNSLPLLNNAIKALDTPVVSSPKPIALKELLGISGSTAPRNMRYVTPEAAAKIGYMSQSRNSPFSSMKHVSGTSTIMADGVGQKRSKFTMVDQETFKQLQKEKELEFVGLHGTAAFAAEAMAKEGIKTSDTSKYSGAHSGGGKGIYTAHSDNATAPEHATNAIGTAQYYARRASLGEPLAFDLDTTKTILAFYRAPTPNLTSAHMPSEILGKPDEIKKFRDKEQALEYHLGKTPLPPQLKGVQAETTLITDHALEGDDVEYYAVKFEPAAKR